jgi:hypothetical protein
MEPSPQQDSLTLVTPTAKEMQMPIFVTSAIETVARMLSRFETRRHVATVSARWLREHEADNGKRG